MTDSTEKPNKPKPLGGDKSSRPMSGRGQGRKPGIQNKDKAALDKALNELLDKKIAKGDGNIGALELLQELYLSKKTPFIVRNAAMRAALPYEAAKKQPTAAPEDQDKERPFEHLIAAAKASLISKLTPEVQSAVSGAVDQSVN